MFDHALVKLAHGNIDSILRRSNTDHTSTVDYACNLPDPEILLFGFLPSLSLFLSRRSSRDSRTSQALIGLRCVTRSKFSYAGQRLGDTTDDESSKDF